MWRAVRRRAAARRRQRARARLRPCFPEVTAGAPAAGRDMPGPRARASGARARAGVREGERAHGGAQAGGPARGRQRGRLGGHRDRRARAGLEDQAGHQRHVPRPGAAPAPLAPLCPTKTLLQSYSLARLTPPPLLLRFPRDPDGGPACPRRWTLRRPRSRIAAAWLCLCLARSCFVACAASLQSRAAQALSALVPGGCARRSGSYDRALRGPPHAVPRLTRGARPRAVEVGVAQPQGLRELSARRGREPAPPRARAGPGAARAAGGAAHVAGRARGGWRRPALGALFLPLQC